MKALSINQQLFLVVYHWNHLPVISAFPLTGIAGIYNYDFSTGSDQAFGGTIAHKEITPGVWGMAAGDDNSDEIITVDDKINFWSIIAGKTGYHPGDYNLDGQINNPDKNDLWFQNLNWESQVPK